MNMRALLFSIGLCLLGAAGSAEAQFTAQLQGTVTDQTGGVLPGAAVVLRHMNTGVELRTASDTDGGFRFPNLAPGGYQLKVELSGFRTATFDATVLTQQTSNVKVTLEVASATEQVSVVGRTAGIDVADSRVHATYGEEALRDLPFQGRNFLGLMAIAPGVTG
ncbi:MAG: carboxypeptidase-like regulatory domain-containing protein, partial [Acidobacteriota bacterium]|nr:carboxypeptidase-like regulatory domain-containing protein [Acidobacteriota bacterium]